jgi:Family of unknown function (DUF5302)
MAVEQSGAEASPAPESPREEAAEEATAKPDLDETKRKFREALERKQARDKAGHGEDHLGGRALGLSTNDKTKRQFRRKSGG